MELIDLSGTGDNDSRFDEFLHRIRLDLGFDEVTFAIICPRAESLIGFSTFTRERNDPSSNTYYFLKDSMRKRLMNCVQPVDWSRLRDLYEDDEIFDGQMARAKLYQGLSVPVRGPLGEQGLLTVAARLPECDWKILKASNIRELQRRAVHLLDMIQASKTLSGLLMRHSLSGREKEILRLAADGRSQAEIAARLAMSERTVAACMGSIKTKLRALNTPQAVGRALMHGLIEA